MFGIFAIFVKYVIFAKIAPLNPLATLCEICHFRQILHFCQICHFRQLLYFTKSASCNWSHLSFRQSSGSFSPIFHRFTILVVECIPIYFWEWANLKFNKIFKFVYVKCSKTNSTTRKYYWGGFVPVLPSMVSSFILGLKGLNKNDIHNQGN